MKSLLPLRTVLVTGKGGVGKTTVAASLARFVAQTGKRVLVAEIASDDALADAAKRAKRVPSAASRASAPTGPNGGDLLAPLVTSALADALGVAKITEEPEEIAPNLWIAALAPTLGHQRFLRDVLPMKVLADAAMRTGAIRRFLAAAPTFPEMGVLYRLLDLVRAKRRDGTALYEMIIVDLPATGHALALAQIPASLLRVVPTGPIAAAVREGLDLLMDRARTGAVVVTLPETLPISEAIELVQGIEQHRIPVAHVIVNRVPLDPFSDEEREFLRRLLQTKPPMLGDRTLERIDRARVALDRIAKGVSVPIGTLQDVWLDGPRLAEEMASLISVDVQRTGEAEQTRPFRRNEEGVA